MVRLLKQRHIEPAEYRARDEWPRVIDSHRVKRCGVCTFLIPEADMVTEDGVEKCPMCVDTYTAEYLANEERDVADVKMASAYALNNPTQFSRRGLQESQPGIVTAITDLNGNTLSQNGFLPAASPANGSLTGQLLMARGVVRTVLMIGVRFTAANITTYPAGISNYTPPLITSSLITLNLLADMSMTPGSYGITMADGVTQTGHEYARIIAVR